MEKINLPFFYELGASLKALATMEVDSSNRTDIWAAATDVESYVRSLLNGYSSLTVCRRAGEELFDRISKVHKWFTTIPPEEWGKKDYIAEFTFRQAIDKAKEFQTVLLAELHTLATYHVSQKGIYLTTGLIEQTEKILPESILGKIHTDIIEEIRQSGKCLAFDVAIASAFHMMRATESVIHEYYLHVCKPQTKRKLDNWGAYIAKLEQSQDLEVQEIVAMLRQIKDRHRNLIMHPEIVLTADDAFTLFEIAQGAIIAMASALPELQKK